MPLPSSAPVTTLRIPGELSYNPVVYNPATADQAWKAGNQQALDTFDQFTIRPKQSAAIGAQADLATAQANADRSIVPTLTKQKETSAKLSTAADEGALAIQTIKNAVSLDPAIQKTLAQGYVAAAKDASARAQTSNVASQAALTDAPVAAATQSLNTDTANLGAQVTNTNAGTAAQVQMSPDNQSGLATQIQAKNTIDTGNAQIAAARFSPNIKAASMEGEQAAALSGSLQQKGDLARTMYGLAVGPAGVSPADADVIKKEASANGVNLFDASGAPRLLPDVAKDNVTAVNIKKAQEPLKTIRDEAASSAGQLEKFQRVQQLIGSKVPTGFIYGTKVGEIYDGIAAEFGNANSDIRKQLTSIQNQLIPEATRGLGRMTIADITLFQHALVGAGNTPSNNAAIITAGIASEQRTLDKQAFYDKLIQTAPIEKIDALWNSYIQQNPLFDLAASTPQKVALNQNTLSPQQYRAAIESPEKTARSLAPTDADSIARLPLADTPAQISAAPATSPFVAVTGARGQRVAAANPKYWSSIVIGHQSIYEAAPATARGNAALGAYQNSLATSPEDQAGQPVIVGVAPVGSLPSDVKIQKRR